MPDRPPHLHDGKAPLQELVGLVREQVAHALRAGTFGVVVVDAAHDLADLARLAPPHHSITSSARASSVGGRVRPSALAVLRLITSSYLVGACTGRSAGFSPLRMRST